MAQLGTANHYCHNGLKGLTRASQRPAKHEWHSMAQLLIISTGLLTPSRAIASTNGTAWHSKPLLPQRPQGPHEGLTKGSWAKGLGDKFDTQM